MYMCSRQQAYTVVHRIVVPWHIFNHALCYICAMVHYAGIVKNCESLPRFIMNLYHGALWIRATVHFGPMPWFVLDPLHVTAVRHGPVPWWTSAAVHWQSLLVILSVSNCTIVFTSTF